MMRPFVLLLLAASLVSPLKAEDPLTLQQALSQPDLTGLHPLDQGYRGKFTEIYDDRKDVVPEVLSDTEFTHVRCESPKAGEAGPVVRELAVGLLPVGRKVVESYILPVPVLKAIPPFEELKGFKAAADFERVFGAAVAQPGSEDGQTKPSLSWLASVPDGNGAIRLVAVTVFTADTGSGPGIENRQIKEGLFSPTGKPPQPVAQAAPAKSDPVVAKKPAVKQPVKKKK